MTPQFWVWTHLSFGLVVFAGLRWVLGRRLSSPARCGVALLGATLAGMIPAGYADFSGLLLAHAGTLSAATLVLLSMRFLKLSAARPASVGNASSAFARLWAVMGCLLYPSALGFLSRDAYALGYAQGFAWAVLLAAAACLALKSNAVGVTLTLAVLAWELHLHESQNLWDYLIDPWIWSFACWRCLATLKRAQRPQRQSAHEAASLNALRAA